MAEGLSIRVLGSLMQACSNRAPIALLKRLARRVGIAKRVHARGLWHTHSAELVAGACLEWLGLRRSLENRLREMFALVKSEHFYEA